MKELIVIGGSPGTGKTTVSNLLAKELDSFVFDFGILREVHLDRAWSNQSEEEEAMSFENLIYIMKNYVKHGYKNIILTDLRDFRVEQIPEVFSELDYVIASLFVSNDKELKKRVEGPRDSGYNNSEKAIEWNKKLIERPVVKNEFKIDNTHNEPNQTVEKILKLL